MIIGDCWGAEEVVGFLSTGDTDHCSCGKYAQNKIGVGGISGGDEGH